MFNKAVFWDILQVNPVKVKKIGANKRDRYLQPEELIIIARQEVIATQKRCFKKHQYWFEPWHYVPLLKQKPGALRNGAPFEHWDLPKDVVAIKKRYMERPHGERDFVELLLLIQTEGVDTVVMACELAIEDKTTG